MKKNQLLILILLVPVLTFRIISTTQSQNFTVVFYNTENLFDIQDDPQTNDADFLPVSRIPWTEERYRIKLQRIAQVLTSIDEKEFPDIVGLCEVENLQVLKDLVSLKELKKGGYGIIHYDSPDERGIDNALLYRKSSFEVIAHKAIPVRLTSNPGDATRDILYVKGMAKELPKDTLHFFVNHWPSRSEGQAESEPNRMDAARTLKKQVDSLFSLDARSRMIIMGDFNDEPDNTSMASILKAYTPTAPPEEMTLYNLMMTPFHEGRGTLYYNEWQMFDQIIVSGYLLSGKSGLTLPDNEGKVFTAEWLLFKPANGEPRPNRTAAKEYYGGYSDHLPVYVSFITK